MIVCVGVRCFFCLGVVLIPRHILCGVGVVVGFNVLVFFVGVIEWVLSFFSKFVCVLLIVVCSGCLLLKPFLLGGEGLIPLFLVGVCVCVCVVFICSLLCLVCLSVCCLCVLPLFCLFACVLLIVVCRC